MEWMELLFPPVNLWSSPRKGDMTQWYDKAVVQIEQEFEDGLLTQKEFRQALKDLDEEYDEAMRLDKHERY